MLEGHSQVGSSIQHFFLGCFVFDAEIVLSSGGGVDVELCDSNSDSNSNSNSNLRCYCGLLLRLRWVRLVVQ